MNRTRRLLAGVLGPAVLASTLFVVPACKSIRDEDVKTAMTVEILATKWIEKEYRSWPKPKLVLVPSVTFRIRNNTAEPMKYVNFNGIFKEKSAVENVGDQFLAAIRNEPIAPRGWSEPITLKSNFGYEGTNLANFKNNPGFKPLWVKIYAQWKGSRHVLMGEWPVSMTIDFQEPGIPVIQGGKPAEPIKK
jgi:hypothetical protein